MHFGAALLGWVLLGSPGETVQHDGEHQATFEEALDHRSIADLTKWREAHPWSLGDRLAIFLDGLLETRKVGERIANERASLQAAFLIEGMAEDPFSGWVLEVQSWDPEACSHHETVVEALSSLPEMIAAGEKKAAWTQIADLRDNVSPNGGWGLCAPILARCAAAFLHAGDREHALQLASELASSAEELKVGSVVAACERLLGEIARESGNLAECERRTSRSFEIAGQLDSGKRGDLLGEIENLEACEIDALLEIAIGEKETLVLASGNRGRGVKILPVGSVWIAERTKRLLDPASFDAAAARELYEKLLRPVEPWLGTRLGIVPDAILSSLPLALLLADGGSGENAKPFRFLGRDHALVYLSRPPLGGRALPPSPEQTRTSGTLVIARDSGSDPVRSEALAWLEGQTSGTLSPVRTIRTRTPGEWAKEAPAAKTLHFDGIASLVPLESLRSMKLHADLVVLANGPPGEKYSTAGFALLAERFHDAGLRDVIGSLSPVPDAFLVRFYAHLARGEPTADAMRAARAEFIDGPEAKDPSSAHPWSWAAWVIHRRN